MITKNELKPLKSLKIDQTVIQGNLFPRPECSVFIVRV